jgi:DNA-binding MarR family transcriptional regulator
MNVTQLAVMRAILRHPNEPLTRAADDLAMDRTSLYRALASLQRKKWVKLNDAGDARSHSASVTESGHMVLAKADAAWARTQTGIVNCFGYARWKAFVLELQHLIDCANTVAASQFVKGARL